MGWEIAVGLGDGDGIEVEERVGALLAGKEK
jgi:hypothetical protein